MSIQSNVGATFAATVDNAPTGLVGTINVRIEDTANTIVTGPTTTGIIESGTGIYTATLVAPDEAGSYLVIWNDGTASAEASDDLIVTAASGYACTIGQIDAVLNRGGVATDYDDDLKYAAREAATTAFEQKANLAIRLKARTDRLDAVSAEDLFLPAARPLRITSLTVDGTTVDPSTVEVLTQEGCIYRAGGWGGTSRRSIVASYEYGYDQTPADLSQAIATLAASLVKDGPFDDRGYGVTDDGGFVRLLTAGVGKASFSIPEVQAALLRYRVPVVA